MCHGATGRHLLTSDIFLFCYLVVSTSQWPNNVREESAQWCGWIKTGHMEGLCYVTSPSCWTFWMSVYWEKKPIVLYSVWTGGSVGDISSWSLSNRDFGHLEWVGRACGWPPVNALPPHQAPLWSQPHMPSIKVGFTASIEPPATCQGVKIGNYISIYQSCDFVLFRKKCLHQR